MPGTNAEYNLLLFEDKQKEELVHIRAQKDYKLHALHDSAINIDHDQSEVVGHSKSKKPIHTSLTPVSRQKIPMPS